MGLLARAFKKRSSGQTMLGRFWTVPVHLVADATYHCNAGALAAVGDVLTIVNPYTRGLQSVLLTIGGTISSGTLTLTVVGKDQFGVTISETVTATATGTKWTAAAYSYITSVTAAGTFPPGGGVTVSVGYQVSCAATLNSSQLSIAMLSAGLPLGAFGAVRGQAGTSTNTFTVNTTYNTIVLTGDTLTSAYFLVWLDPTYGDQA